MSLRVLGSNYLWRTTVYGTEGRWQLFLTIPPAGGKFEGSGSQSGGGGFARRRGRDERDHVDAAAQRGHGGRGDAVGPVELRELFHDVAPARLDGRGRRRHAGVGCAVHPILIRVDRSPPRRRRRALRRAEHALDAEGFIGGERHARRLLSQARAHRARVVVGERVRERVARIPLDGRSDRRPHARADHGVGVRGRREGGSRRRERVGRRCSGWT